MANLFMFAQLVNEVTKPLGIGEQCPNIMFSDIENFSRKNFSVNDAKGKWLIIDFWSEICSGCLNSFPKTNELQKKYGHDIQFILDGDPGYNIETIRSLFRKLKMKFNLELPTVFDKSLVKLFGVGGLPYYVLIDPHGIIKGFSEYIDSEILDNLLSGKVNNFPKPYNAARLGEIPPYNYNIPFLVNENGGNDSSFLFRSLISKWDSNKILPYGLWEDDNRFELLGMSLKSMFRLAYIGRDYWSPGDSIHYGVYAHEPLLRVQDSSIFQTGKTNRLNLFCYSLTKLNRKLAKVDRLKIMQNDLYNYFGFKAHFETLMSPCYVLTASKETKNKILSKGGFRDARYLHGTHNGWYMQNVPITYLIDEYIPLSIGSPKEIPFFNETRIVENIDITLEATYFDDLVKELNSSYGLVLTKEYREMRVLVIDDSE